MFVQCQCQKKRTSTASTTLVHFAMCRWFCVVAMIHTKCFFLFHLFGYFGAVNVYEMKADRLANKQTNKQITHSNSCWSTKHKRMLHFQILLFTPNYFFCNSHSWWICWHHHCFVLLMKECRYIHVQIIDWIVNI